MNLVTYSLLVLVLIIAFYFTFYKARPAKNQQGISIFAPENGFQENKKKQLIIGTYNIQTGKDVHGNRNINRSARIIQNADIVGIQEVYAKSWLGRASQAQQLAEYSADAKMNFGWLFAATRLRWMREHRGNAMLSRLPVKRWTVEMLPDQTGKQFRNLITAIIEFDGQEVAILITHLHTKRGQAKQLEIVLEKSKQYDRAILLGDFNTNSSNPLLVEFLNDSSFIDAISIANKLHGLVPQASEDSRIDWILTKGFHVRSGSSEPIGISDHPYFEVTLSLAKNK